MKKFLIPAVLILVLAFGGFYFLKDKGFLSSNIQSDVLKSFADWKTYDGKSTLGLTLKYPAEWTVTVDENYNDYVDFAPAKGNSFAALIIKDVNKKQTLAAWLKARDKELSEEMGGQYKDKVISTKKVKVGKLSAVQRVEYLDAAGFTLIHTYVKKDNNVFMFTLRINSGVKYSSADAKIYSKILSTVQFSK